ncbi:hypothetical protein SPONN_177 [uncultured Candidatus Thioglobus sp.]|nr:hypothetical protein SPONN_177 [uncultured Candidatus Thioglobus sp.]
MKETVLIILLGIIFTGCTRAQNTKQKYKELYSAYSCDKLFKSMDYKVSEANILYTNAENENSITKVGIGGLGVAAGTAMVSGLILTPLGWILAGSLALGGVAGMIDGIDHSELSNSEKITLREYRKEYEAIKEIAIQKKCDYYNIPKWNIS